MRQAKLSKEIEVVQWEENLTKGPLGGPMENMWEVGGSSLDSFFQSHCPEGNKR